MAVLTRMESVAASGACLGRGEPSDGVGHLHDLLTDLHATLKRLAAEHRDLCRADVPDRRALAMNRWRIADVGRRRMALLTDTVFPLLERRCRGSERAMAASLSAGTDVYRRGISAYVATWSMGAILADWENYRIEAEGFRWTVSARLAAERAILLPPLLRFGSPCAMAHDDA